MVTTNPCMPSPAFGQRGAYYASPVSIKPRFLAIKPTTLNMKCDNHLFHGATYTVKTASSDLQVLSVENGPWTTHRAKKFFDAVGNHIFNLRLSPTATTVTYYIELPSGQRIVQIDWLRMDHAGAEITFDNAMTRMEERLHLCGTKNGSSAQIKDLKTGQVVASREIKTSQVGSKKSAIVVEENMDVSLATAIFVCLDEVLKMIKM